MVDFLKKGQSTQTRAQLFDIKK